MDHRRHTSILTSDTPPAARIGLFAWIASDPGLGEVGEAQSGCEVIDAIASQLEPFLDALSQHGQPGSALEVRVTVAILHLQKGRQGYVRDFVEAGPALIPLLRQAAAQGFVPECSDRLPAALGRAGLRSGRATATQPAALIQSLSERELEVLGLLAAGLCNKDLAAQLFLSVGTVKQHLHHINGKLGTTSRSSAVARARHLGIL